MPQNISILRNDRLDVFEIPKVSTVYDLKRRFPHLEIVSQPPRTILNTVKSKLKSLNISDLSKAGHYVMGQRLQVKKGGLYGNINFLRSFHRTISYSTYLPMRHWRQTEAVLIADTLDLRNQTIEIDRTQVSEFWIIAKKIIAHDSAKIIYSPTENPRKGQQGRGGHNALNYGGSCQGGHSARNGADGGNGHDGYTGPDGANAPSVKIFVLEIDSMPDILVAGQQGGQGGRGGYGGRGGQGERGRSSDSKWYGLGLYCSRRRGSGGHGGDGGDGGRGGRGGDGGRGGMVTIATEKNQLESLIQSRGFTIDVGGGDGGKAGIQGEVGSHGKGGRKGCDDDWACDDDAGSTGRNGQNGQKRGSRGSGRKGQDSTLNISDFTKEDWNLQLEAPIISRLENNRVYAGDQIIVHGLHFVKDRSSVYIDNTRVNSNYNNDKQITFTVSETMNFGKHLVYVKTSDGDRSNKLEFKVKPYILTVYPQGDLLIVTGRSFSTSVGILYNGKSLDIHSSSQTEIKAEVPEKIGRYNGGSVTIQVVNRDGYGSNRKSMKTLPYVNSGFKANPNGWHFKNYSNGVGAFGSFTDVFGTDEVVLEGLLHPVLTPLYYAFFRNFLRSNGHCSGMALRSLEEFYKGNFDLYRDYPENNSGLKKRIDIAQGRLLSHELLTHYGDQVDEGLNRVEKTLREIEHYLSRASLDSDNARTLSFLPSGSIFDVENIKRSHTVVPTKLVYALSSHVIAGKRSLDGAKLYIYDNNKVGNDDVYLDIKEVNGKIHYSYDGYSSEGSNPMTLGTWTLKKQLFDDVDLPLNIPFVIDILLSPAHLQIEDNDNNVLGYKNGKIHTNKDLGYVSPWTEKLLLSKAGKNSSKKIMGYADGRYTLASKHPNGKTVVLKEIECSSKTEDILVVEDDYKHLSLRTKENKTVNISFMEQDFSSATTLHDGEMKELKVSYKSLANKKLDFAFDMDNLSIKYDEELSLNIETKVYNKSGKVVFRNKLKSIKLLPSKALSMSGEIWKNKSYKP